MMNVKHLYVAMVLALLAAPFSSGRAVDIIDQDQDNSIPAVVESSRPAAASVAARASFVKISGPPVPHVTQTRGTSVELECEVTGSPTPSVQWVHGSGQMAEWEDTSVNVINEENPTSVGRVVSRLVIDHASRAAQTTYTCIGRSAGQVAMASTTVHHVDGTHGNFSGPQHFFMNLKSTRITLYYRALFEYMGTTVILPCKAVGRPVPEVTWFNADGNAIDSLQDGRFRTLPTGELIISSLRWADMGSYTCIAKNAISKDEAETFLYPVRPN